MKINLRTQSIYVFVFIAVFLASLFVLYKLYPVSMEVHLKTPQNEQHFLYYEQLGKITTVEGSVRDNVVKYSLPIGIRSFSFLTDYNDNISGISFNEKPVSFATFAVDFNSIKKSMLGWLCLLALGISIAGTVLTYIVVWFVRHEKELTCNTAFINLEKLLAGISIAIFACSFLMRLNYVPPVDAIDLSWIWALDYMKEFGFNFGKDITFTYGPLGYLLMPVYHKTTPLAVILVIGLILAFVVLLIVYGRMNDQRNLPRLVIWGLVYVLFCWVPTCEWAWNFLLFFVLVFAFNVRDNRKLFTILSVIAGVLSAVSLFLKFNSALLAIGMGGFLGVIILVAYRKYFLRYFLAFSISYLIVAILGAMLFFENFVNFINWFHISLEISKGFSYAFSVPAQIYYYGLLLVVLLLYVFIFLLGRKGGKDFVSLAAFSLVFVFFAYKHSFTRADSHMYTFFSMMPFIMGLLYLFASARVSKTILLLFVTCSIVCSFFSYHVMYGKRALPATVQGISNILHYNTQLAENNARFQDILGDYILPDDWWEMIGDSSIQLLPWDLLYAEANDLKGWQPSPILQLYSAYTYKLDNISAVSLSGINAPEFVLIRHENAGLKNLYLNNPATWNAVFVNYEVEKYDENNKRILLRRNTEELNQLSFKSIGVQTYSFDQWIELPASDKPVYAKIKTHTSLYGKLSTMFFQGSRSVMVIKTLDGNEKMKEIINDVLLSPTLISHVPINFEQMLALATKGDLDVFRVNQIMISNPKPMYYRGSVEIEWLELTDD